MLQAARLLPQFPPSERAAPQLAAQVRDVLDDCRVDAVVVLRVGVGAGCSDCALSVHVQGARGERTEAALALEFLALGEHALGLSSLRLSELRRDDDQAEVDHEEGADDDEDDEVDLQYRRIIGYAAASALTQLWNECASCT